MSVMVGKQLQRSCQGRLTKLTLSAKSNLTSDNRELRGHDVLHEIPRHVLDGIPECRHLPVEDGLHL